MLLVSNALSIGKSTEVYLHKHPELHLIELSIYWDLLVLELETVSRWNFSSESPTQFKVDLLGLLVRSLVNLQWVYVPRSECANCLFDHRRFSLLFFIQSFRDQIVQIEFKIVRSMAFVQHFRQVSTVWTVVNLWQYVRMA